MAKEGQGEDWWAYYSKFWGYRQLDCLPYSRKKRPLLLTGELFWRVEDQKEEKQQQVMRLSVLANRNEEFHTEDELTVLYNYAIGKAYLDSRWKKQKKS